MPTRALVFDDLPAGMAQGMINLFALNAGALHFMWEAAYDLVFRVPTVQVSFPYKGPFLLGINLSTATRADVELRAMFLAAPWSVFFDMCEVILTGLPLTGLPARGFPAQATNLVEGFNEQGRQHSCGYEFVDGQIVRRLAPATGSAIQKACLALGGEPRWARPEEQFQNAIKALNARPPDAKNAVKDAVGATEACLRIATGKPKGLTSKLLQEEPFNSELHPAVRQSIVKLYGCRGDAPGVGHGDAGGHRVGMNEAEYVVAASGAACALIIGIASEHSE